MKFGAPPFGILPAVLMFLGANVLGALGALACLDWPPSTELWLSYFLPMMVMSMLAPVTLLWASGPGALEPMAVAVAISVPLLVAVTFYLGNRRGRSGLWLVAAGAIWSVFGGFTAWLAMISGV